MNEWMNTEVWHIQPLSGVLPEIREKISSKIRETAYNNTIAQNFIDFYGKTFIPLIFIPILMERLTKYIIKDTSDELSWVYTELMYEMVSKDECAGVVSGAGGEGE